MNAPTPPLARLLPPPGIALDPDEILNRFLGYVAEQGLSLYPAQEEAILELVAGKHLLLSTPTGSGKSLVAYALMFKAACEGKVAYYTAPIKALVNEKFFELCNAFGADNVGMATGDATINADAHVICCTAEILANLALRDPSRQVDAVVMDEFHYYADKERGVAWQVPLLLLERATFLLMSATLGDTTSIEQSLQKQTGREIAAIRSAQRPVPLDYEYAETPLHETIEKLIGTGRYPIYLVNFTQKAAAEQAQNLMSVNFSSKEEKAQINQALEGFKFDSPFGKEIQRHLRHGIGLHHAGLLPKYRLLVERLAQSGLLKVISGTDTLGVGVNIPIRTVLFTQLCKFDGQKSGILSVRDFQQIAGRAGRKGFDDRGTVVAQAPEHVIENARIAEKGKKNAVKKQPPQKGYVHWDKSTFEKLITRSPEALESRFQVTHGMLLNLLQAPRPPRGGGYGRLIQLIGRSHESPYLQKKHRRWAKRLFQSLRTAGIIDVVPGEQRSGRFVEIHSSLQRDFSLNHTLSLFLLDLLGRLEKEREEYPLDVVTVVESILENPMAVLYKQVDRAKGEKIEELKAQGMEYNERMIELEKVEWPKPLREFIYANFNAFEAKYPWLSDDAIRPKSVARELLEGFASFNDYVRSYSLQRSEGVLLRYLGDVYRTLVQNVPEAFKTVEVVDAIQALRTLLKSVDSSLIDEWESLRNPAGIAIAATVATPAGPLPIDHDPRAFASRLRAELHRLLRALASRDWDEALQCIWDPAHAWDGARLDAELAPFFAEHPRIDLTPRARRPQQTFIDRLDVGSYRARQRILVPVIQAKLALPEGAEPPEEADADWMIEATVALDDGRPRDAPLISLVRVGT
jgi:superfamily II RNA helicase